MIRVPFFTSVERHDLHHRGFASVATEHQPVSESSRGERMEARLEALESRLISHAEELKSQIAGRVMRIQSRIERALRPFQPESERERVERNADNVVEFGEEGGAANEPVDHLLHACNAREAMLELNETLRVTREHLESLARSIEQMRDSLAAR
jgi:hypothetical protein